jgi:hypothetical protein
VCKNSKRLKSSSVVVMKSLTFVSFREAIVHGTRGLDVSIAQSDALQSQDTHHILLPEWASKTDCKISSHESGPSLAVPEKPVSDQNSRN